MIEKTDVIEVADVDDIYAFGKCIDIEYAQNENDNFQVYETWRYRNVDYRIGRNYTENEGRTSIIVSVKKVEMRKCFVCKEEKPFTDFTEWGGEKEMELCYECWDNLKDVK
jgi:hypothetical protein